MTKVNDDELTKISGSGQDDGERDERKEDNPGYGVGSIDPTSVGDNDGLQEIQ